MSTKTNATNNDMLVNQSTDNKPEISFAKFIKKKRRELSIRLYGAKIPKETEDEEVPKKMISTKEVAGLVGIKESMFPKILNMQKPTKERDCIIAICIVLQIESDEADKALHLYNNMPCLDYSIPRECFLIELMDEHSTDDPPITIQKVNKMLEENGFEKLHINSNRRKPVSDNKYEISRIETETYLKELLYTDYYNSLVTKYRPDRYRSIAKMQLSEINSDREYVLFTDNHGECWSEIYENGKVSMDYSLSETGEFKQYFLRLRSEVRRELKMMLNVLDDTKNYQDRISAEIKDDNFCIYAETFSYSIPEINEYYFMEKLGNQFHLMVYNESVFMSHYLSEVRYKELYKKTKKAKLVAEYYSVDEIESSEKDKYSSERLLSYRKRVFSILQHKIETLLDDIRCKKTYVRNLDFIYDDRDRVCSFFNVEEEYQCSMNGEFGDFMVAGNDRHDFVINDGELVTITLNDLYIAFELGFNNITEICRVKRKLGSIEAIIKNN